MRKVQKEGVVKPIAICIFAILISLNLLVVSVKPANAGLSEILPNIESTSPNLLVVSARSTGIFEGSDRSTGISEESDEILPDIESTACEEGAVLGPEGCVGLAVAATLGYIVYEEGGKIINWLFPGPTQVPQLPVLPPLPDTIPTGVQEFLKNPSQFSGPSWCAEVSGGNSVVTSLVEYADSPGTSQCVSLALGEALGTCSNGGQGINSPNSLVESFWHSVEDEIDQDQAITSCGVFSCFKSKKSIYPTKSLSSERVLTELQSFLNSNADICSQENIQAARNSASNPATSKLDKALLCSYLWKCSGNCDLFTFYSRNPMCRGINPYTANIPSSWRNARDTIQKD
ncbi:hypothetical protein [Calothrix rhizosoleniae]|uniref:hypothetical protein n=1 Tax=Calothrix rhizosoleniae TaxID=888997 RepID=UPI000B4A15B4|nr:hypothetical protein [Calothrix rhizosoleniae]